MEDDEDFQEVSDVFKRYEDELISRNGVNSVGICKDANGHYIEVTVGPGYRGGLPKEIEGVSIIVVKGEKLKAR